MSGTNCLQEVGKGREHDHMDVGGRTMSGTVVEAIHESTLLNIYTMLLKG